MNMDGAGGGDRKRTDDGCWGTRKAGAMRFLQLNPPPASFTALPPSPMSREPWRSRNASVVISHGLGPPPLVITGRGKSGGTCGADSYKLFAACGGSSKKWRKLERKRRKRRVSHAAWKYPNSFACCLCLCIIMHHASHNFDHKIIFWLNPIFGLLIIQRLTNLPSPLDSNENLISKLFC